MNMVFLMKDHEHGDSNQLDGEKKKVKAPGMVYFCKSLLSREMGAGKTAINLLQKKSVAWLFTDLETLVCSESFSSVPLRDYSN